MDQKHTSWDRVRSRVISVPVNLTLSTSLCTGLVMKKQWGYRGWTWNRHWELRPCHCKWIFFFFFDISSVIIFIRVKLFASDKRWTNKSFNFSILFNEFFSWKYESFFLAFIFKQLVWDWLFGKIPGSLKFKITIFQHSSFSDYWHATCVYPRDRSIARGVSIASFFFKQVIKYPLWQIPFVSFRNKESSNFEYCDPLRVKSITKQPNDGTIHVNPDKKSVSYVTPSGLSIKDVGVQYFQYSIEYKNQIHLGNVTLDLRGKPPFFVPAHCFKPPGSHNPFENSTKNTNSNIR